MRKIRPVLARPVLPRWGRRTDLRELLRTAFESGDRRRIRAALVELHAAQLYAEELASPAWVPEGQLLRETIGIQSVQFMVDLLPHIQARLAQEPRGARLTVLDVGPGTGLGTALLASLYCGSRLGYLMDVTALDNSSLYRDYVPTVSPYVNFVQADVFTHGTTYDLVIASHVIEHLPDPVQFCRRLQEISRKAVFVAAPFAEPRDRLTRGHVSVIDEGVVAELAPESFRVVESRGWGAFEDPPYRMLIAELAGRAAGR